MTLPRLYAFLDYWKSAPPVAETVAAFVGLKPAGPAAPAKAANDERERTEFLAAIPMQAVRLPA